jgi:hypothetical protein
MFRLPRKVRPSTRATARLPGSGRNHGYAEESRIVGFDAPASIPPPTAGAQSDDDWSDWLWLSLIMFAVAAAAALQVMH